MGTKVTNLERTIEDLREEVKLAKCPRLNETVIEKVRREDYADEVQRAIYLLEYIKKWKPI